MENRRSEISVLIFKKLQETITPTELTVLEQWANSAPENRMLLDHILKEEQLIADVKSFDDLWRDPAGANRYKKMEKAVLAQVSTPARNLWKKWISYAAIIAGIAICTGIWMLNQRNSTEGKHSIALKTKNVKPEGNSAVLTLSDGREINLSTKQEGIIISDDILYGDSSAVLSKETQALKKRSDLKNYQLKLATPNGVSYRVTLADGSQVWLNAGSTLYYPAKFNDTERIVELQGEAYFDVTSKTNKRTKNKVPFIVKTNGQNVRVIGTQFNISAYEEDAETITTLVEGKVAVGKPALKEGTRKETMLKPGQQSINSFTNDILVKQVDVTPFIAWKDGLFYFKNTPFEEIMKQISRWYNVEVIYKKGIPKETFTGKMNRSLSLSSVLELLNVSNVSVHIEDKKLIVN